MLGTSPTPVEFRGLLGHAELSSAEPLGLLGLRLEDSVLPLLSGEAGRLEARTEWLPEWLLHVAPFLGTLGTLRGRSGGL